MKLRVAKKIVGNVDRYNHHSVKTLERAVSVWAKHGGRLGVARECLLSYRFDGFIRV